MTTINGYLKNDSVFSLDNLGIITVAGNGSPTIANSVGDRIDINTYGGGQDRFGAHSFSIQFWCRMTKPGVIFSTGSAGATNTDACIWQFKATNTGFAWWDSSGGYVNNITVNKTDWHSLNSWQFLTITYSYNENGHNIARIYTNNVFRSQGNIATSSHSFIDRAWQSSLQYTLGGGYDSSCLTANTAGKFGPFIVYNKTLSNQEVEQNYLAFRDRFMSVDFTPYTITATTPSTLAGANIIVNYTVPEAGDTYAIYAVEPDTNIPKVVQGLFTHDYEAVSYGLSDQFHNQAGVPGWGLYNRKTGQSFTNGGRSYRFFTINRTSGAMVDRGTYDVFGDPAEATRLATDLNAVTADRIVVIISYDEPSGNRTLGGLPAAIYRCGGSQRVFGKSNFSYRSAYILVGVAGIGEGGGIECLSGSKASDPTAYARIRFKMVGGNIRPEYAFNREGNTAIGGTTISTIESFVGYVTATTTSGSIQIPTDYSAITERFQVILVKNLFTQANTKLARSQTITLAPSSNTFYDEGANAQPYVSNWNSSDTYTMASVSGLGEVKMHGTSATGPQTFTVQVGNYPNDFPPHTEARYRVYWHFVDSLDAETSWMKIDDIEVARFVKTGFPGAGMVGQPVYSKLDMFATWTPASYSYAPWGNNSNANGYVIFDTGIIPHTKPTIKVDHYLGYDQVQSDEAMYLSHVKVDLFNRQLDGSSPELAAPSAKYIKQINPSAPNGFYWIRPAANLLPIRVWCDMFYDNGGWVLVMSNCRANTFPEFTGSNGIAGSDGINYQETLNNLTVKNGPYNSSMRFSLMVGLRYWESLGKNMVQFAAIGTPYLHQTTLHSKRARIRYEGFSPDWAFLSPNYIGNDGSNANPPGLLTYHMAGAGSWEASDRINGGHSPACNTYYGGNPWWYRQCWSGSMWGGGSSGLYTDGPWWEGSSADNHNYMAIYLKVD